jgi:tetratricopeptide (TPR) repeat protein
MKKSVFFCLAALILLGGVGQAEVPDKKPAIGKNDEANQMIIKGNQSFSAQRYDEAITFYKQALTLDPESIDVKYNLGVAFGKKGMLDDSIAAYEQVIAVNPRHAQAHNNLGITYEKKGMAEKAHSEYEKAVSADPNLAPALYNLGKSYLTRGAHDQAAAYLYKAGLLFHKSKNNEWAKKSYDLLKQTNAGEREKELYELLNLDSNGSGKEKISK